MKFAPRPKNEFREFYASYFERCVGRFGRIEALAAKWTFEDLLPGMSDFDTRLICADGMTADDWIEMSLAVGATHAEMTREFPRWARILEHLPGLNLTWRELGDPRTYYPEYNQWTFYLGDADALAAAQRALRSMEWTTRDEYFHVKKFSVYYGPYQRGIDPAINLWPYENKYPLHSRIWHYFVTPLQSALSILEQRNITGKMEALRLARRRLANGGLIDRVMEILDVYYEVSELCEDPGLARFEEELRGYLERVYATLAGEVTLFEARPGDTLEELRARVAAVSVDPVQQFFEMTRFCRLMKGRLLFYAEEIPHFDSIPCIRIDLGRMRYNFFEQPLAIYGRMRYGERLSPEEVAARLAGDLWSAAEYEGVMSLARLAHLPARESAFRRRAREIADVFEPFLRAMEKLSSHVRREFAAGDARQARGAGDRSGVQGARGKMHAPRAGSRRRFLDALEHRFTGEVPFIECYVADTVVDEVLGTRRGKHMLQLAPPDYVEFLERSGMDAGYIYEGWFLGRRNKVDENGRVKYIDGTIKSRADFDQIVPPPLDNVRRRIEGFLECSRHLDLACIFAPDEASSIAFTAVGPADYMLAAHDDPGFLDELMDRLEEYTLAVVEYALEYPVDAIMMTGPWCAKDGPMMSPEMHERLVFPRMQKVLDRIAPRGLPAILHVDGDASAFLGRIMGMGFAGVHPVEPGIARWDIYNLKREFGHRLCLWGNIDVGGCLSKGTPEDVERETLEHLERLSPGGGYICGSSHDITKNVPFENFEALARTICSYRAR